jgi:two-component system, LytTR family, sensor histidine kinase LytS
MVSTMFYQMAERMALVITIAYLLTRLKVFRRLLHNEDSYKEKILLTLIFAAIGIFGTYSAVRFQGALANSRVIGPVMAGLLGGPLMGGGAGLISGLHRWSMGGFTGFSCGLSTFAAGIIAGIARMIFKDTDINWEFGLYTGILTESLQMAIILGIAKPYSAALALVKIIGLPMIIANSIGIAIFMLIVTNVREEEKRYGAIQAQKALSIADTASKYLRNGLNRETAQSVCEVIKEHTDVDAVAITDTFEILAHVGEGANHHLPGQPLMTDATRWVLEYGSGKVAESKREIACSYPRCPLKSAIIVPLFSRGQVVGTLKLYHSKEKAVSQLDQEFAKGLAHLFSTQLEIAALEIQSKLLKEAELEALQAQINPHFLYNALNTVISFSRSDVELSRKLLRQLGDFFRKSILKDRKVITLAEEMERIDAYLSIEQARFGNRLKVSKEIDAKILNYPMPPFILQPLVENCIKHGILPGAGGGTVCIRAQYAANSIHITVEDNGVGMPEGLLADCLKHPRTKDRGIGLVNVNDRLKAVYGPEAALNVKSAPGKGTLFSIVLPAAGSEGGELAS